MIKNKLIISTLLFLCAAQGLVADISPQQSLKEALLQTKKDIDLANNELGALRESISTQRIPLAKKLDALQKEVRNLRKKSKHVREIRVQSEKEYAVIVAQTESLDEVYNFLLTLFSEYRRSIETRASVAESVLLRDALIKIDNDLDEDKQELLEKFPVLADKILKLAKKWNSKRIGGALFLGTALDENGIEQTGEFAAFGPLAYFAASDSTKAALVVTGFGTSLPSLYEDIPKDAAQHIISVVQGNEAQVPVDLTSGDALKIKQARQGLIAHAKQGGFVMIPLLLIGALAAILSLWKFISLSRIRIHAGSQVMKILDKVKDGHIDEAWALAEKFKDPLASLLKEGIEHRNASREHLEEIMYERVLGYMPHLERHLGALAVFGGIAPLLGLLGTVTGMIHTFQLVTIFGSGDAKLLSGGISEALVTTEFGLAIAIPVLLIHAFLSRKSKVIIGALEQTATNLVNELKIRAKKS